MIEFRPALLTSLKHYSREKFTADLMAGIIVGIVALPLAIAFGIASGVSPEKGIITAIIAGFLTSALGGSRVQIGGPTGAFIVIVYGIIQQYGIEGLTVATIMAGVFLILLGLFRLGTIIKFIPYPIVVGFTSGIAVTIFEREKELGGVPRHVIPSFRIANETIAKDIAMMEKYGVEVKCGKSAPSVAELKEMGYTLSEEELLRCFGVSSCCLSTPNGTLQAQES